MPANTDPAAIARRLSPYERDAAIALLDGEPIHFFDTSSHQRLARMVKIGLFEKRRAMEWHATPLGLAVRAALEAEGGADA